MVKMRQPNKRGFLLWGGSIKAQTVLEYAIVIMCLIAALLVMQVYIKRSMQGRLRQLADELGQQYSPRNTIGNQSLAYNSTTTSVVRTLSEYEINAERYAAGEPLVDLNGNGNYADTDVYATETLSVAGELVNTDKGRVIVGGSNTTVKQEETVGPLESSL